MQGWNARKVEESPLLKAQAKSDILVWLELQRSYDRNDSSGLDIVLPATLVFNWPNNCFTSNEIQFKFPENFTLDKCLEARTENLSAWVAWS